MKAMACICVYNEADILGWVLCHLLGEGIDVYVSDNWSTDGSLEIAKDAARAYPGRVLLRSYPTSGPVESVALNEITADVEQLALEMQQRGYDWCIHHDADEFRYSPRKGERLIDMIARMDSQGFTAINAEIHTYAMGNHNAIEDPRVALTVEDPLSLDRKTPQLKCWKQPAGIRVNLHECHGHDVRFPGRKVAPERMILHHYPLRNPEQAKRKIAERKARWSKAERSRGMHCQYDNETIQ